MTLAAELPVHALRAARIRQLLRLLLVGFYVAVLLTEPPAEQLIPCWVIVGCYLLWTIATGFLATADPRAQRLLWVALVVDVAVLTLLTLLSDTAATQSWTPYLLINGFFVIPIIAAAQLNPWMCAAVVAPTVLVQFVAGALIRDVGGEPWSYVVLRTVVLSAVSLGAVLLSRLQRARVRRIAGLLADRTALLEELLVVQQREQQDLAEVLHDGALQYVLGARQQLEDVVDGDRSAGQRVDEALREAARLLRSTTSQLHPAVLEAAGLPAALNDLVETVRARQPLQISLVVEGWDDRLRSSIDRLMFAGARELLTNVVKHAEADRVEVALRRDPSEAVLTVADDGRGMGSVDLAARLEQGHLGLASLRVRMEAAGGSLGMRAAQPHGTVVDLRLPLPGDRSNVS